MPKSTTTKMIALHNHCLKFFPSLFTVGCCQGPQAKMFPWRLWAIERDKMRLSRKHRQDIMNLLLYLDIERSSRLAPEAPDLLDEPHGCLTDQDPHALPLLLNLPRHHRRLRHHAVVGDFCPGDNSDGGTTSLFAVKQKTLLQLFFVTCEIPF